MYLTVSPEPEIPRTAFDNCTLLFTNNSSASCSPGPGLSRLVRCVLFLGGIGIVLVRKPSLVYCSKKMFTQNLPWQGITPGKNGARLLPRSLMLASQILNTIDAALPGSILVCSFLSFFRPRKPFISTYLKKYLYVQFGTTSTDIRLPKSASAEAVKNGIFRTVSLVVILFQTKPLRGRTG